MYRCNGTCYFRSSQLEWKIWSTCTSKGLLFVPRINLRLHNYNWLNQTCWKAPKEAPKETSPTYESYIQLYCVTKGKQTVIVVRELKPPSHVETFT